MQLQVDQEGMKISTKKIKVLCLSRNPVHAASQRQHTAADQEVEVTWGGIHSDGRRNRKIDARIGKANAILRELLSLCGHKTRTFKHR